MWYALVCLVLSCLPSTQEDSQQTIISQLPRLAHAPLRAHERGGIPQGGPARLTRYVFAVTNRNSAASQQVHEFQPLLGLLFAQPLDHQRPAPQAAQVSVHRISSHTYPYRSPQESEPKAAQAARRHADWGGVRFRAV